MPPNDLVVVDSQSLVHDEAEICEADLNELVLAYFISKDAEIYRNGVYITRRPRVRIQMYTYGRGRKWVINVFGDPAYRVELNEWEITADNSLKQMFAQKMLEVR